MADYERLRELAVSATDGPWDTEASPLMVHCNDLTGQRIADCTNDLTFHTDEQKAANAAYIAEANPATIKALLSELDALKAERDRLREALEMIRHNWAGHSEICESVMRKTAYGRGKCDCDWPRVAEKCDAALAQTPPEDTGPVPAAGSNSGGSTAEDGR
jgi:hypothetical protein